jgi:hypothetical protein
MKDRDPVIVWLWDVPGPARTACGVTGSQTRARQAAEAILIAGQGTTAALEQAVLGLGAASMTYGYQRTGQAWDARLIDGHVTWTRTAPHLAAS